MKKLICCMCILVLSTLSSGHVLAQQTHRLPSPDEYYLILREIAQKEYGGIDLDAKLNAGYTFSYGDSTSEYVGDSGMIMTSSESGTSQGRHSIGANISIPLFSKEEKLTRRQKVTDFLQKGTALIQQLELAVRTREIQTETLTVMNETAKEGLQGALAIKDMQIEIARQETLIKQYHRDIQTLINPHKKPLSLTIDGLKFLFSTTTSVVLE